MKKCDVECGNIVIAVVDATATDRATWRFVRNVVCIGAIRVVHRYESDGIAHRTRVRNGYRGLVATQVGRARGVDYIRDI